MQTRHDRPATDMALPQEADSCANHERKQAHLQRRKLDSADTGKSQDQVQYPDQADRGKQQSRHEHRTHQEREYFFKHRFRRCRDASFNQTRRQLTGRRHFAQTTIQFRSGAGPTGSGNEKGLAPEQAPTLRTTGADGRNRTVDLLITNQLLYQLSYISEARYSSKKIMPRRQIYLNRRFTRRDSWLRVRLRSSIRGKRPLAGAGRPAGCRGCGCGRQWRHRLPAR